MTTESNPRALRARELVEEEIFLLREGLHSALPHERDDLVAWEWLAGLIAQQFAQVPPMKPIAREEAEPLETIEKLRPQTQSKNRPTPAADPRMVEFERLVTGYSVELVDLARRPGVQIGSVAKPCDDAADALRAWVAAQLAERDRLQSTVDMQADDIALLSRIAERPEPVGNATVVTQVSGPMAGTLGEYTDLRIGQIIPRGIYALIPVEP